METNRLPALLAMLVLSLPACATYPKVMPNAPLELHRGNWVEDVTFSQRGQRVDGDDARTTLAQNPASTSAAGTARAFETCALVSAIAAGALIGVGAAQGLNKHDSWPYFVGSGAAVLGVSVGFAIGADGKYDTAVDAYNRQLGPSAAPR